MISGISIVNYNDMSVSKSQSKIGKVVLIILGIIIACLLTLNTRFFSFDKGTVQFLEVRNNELVQQFPIKRFGESLLHNFVSKISHLK